MARQPANTRTVEAGSRPGALWPRALALSGLLVAADLWCERHLGFGLENPAGLLGLTGAMTLGSHVLDRLIEKRERKQLEKLMEAHTQRVLEQLLGWRMLAALATASLIVAASVSSIVVVPPAQSAAIEAELSVLGTRAVLDRRQFGEGAVPARFLLATTPFGRALRLRVTGYAARVVTVFPLGGLTVDVTNDLVALPTIYFRPSVEGLASMKDGGRFRLFKGAALVAESPEAHIGSAFLVGTRRPVPPDYLRVWQLELEAGGVTGEPFGEVMLAWMRPAALSPNEEFAPGDEIRGVVCAPSKQKVAEALVTVDRSPFQDVGMGVPSPDAGGNQVCS